MLRALCSSVRRCLRSSVHLHLANSANGLPTGTRLIQDGCSEAWGHADQQWPAGLGINEELQKGPVTLTAGSVFTKVEADGSRLSGSWRIQQ